MTRTISRAIGLALGTAAFAIMTGPAAGAWQSQTTSPAGTQAPRTSSSQQTSSSGQQVTVTGCIQREADYRRSTDAGRGGVAATGIGTGNEFVLANAMLSPTGSSTAAATSGARTPSATGTAGTSGTAYELTGSKEGDASTFVGKHVEISGMLKPEASPSGGPTANLPGSQDLKLRELEISSIRETTGTCSTPAAR
jgi:hypothetical protein